jgi:hypothetical protein
MTECVNAKERAALVVALNDLHQAIAKAMHTGVAKRAVSRR